MPHDTRRMLATFDDESAAMARHRWASHYTMPIPNERAVYVIGPPVYGTTLNERLSAMAVAACRRFIAHVRA